MNEVARKRLSQKVTLKLRPTDVSSHARSGWEEETFPSKGNSRRQDPEADKRLTYKELKEAHVLEACVGQWLELKLETWAGKIVLCFADQGKDWISL